MVKLPAFISCIKFVGHQLLNVVHRLLSSTFAQLSHFCVRHYVKFNKIMRTLSVLILLFAFALSSYSQGRKAKEFIIKGKVEEGSSKQELEYATISVFTIEGGNLVAGTTTDQEGRFMVSTLRRDIYVEASFIGYEKTVIREIKFENGVADLGVIYVAENAEMMDEVVISAEKSQTEFKLDKRVFNVGQDLSSTGASALEVLNNVPSVTVSIEGEVALRGNSGVQMLVNGKPSIIASDSGNALGTITADMIEKVEVITNPSAKYDAEGTAGIINIILKKEEKKGLNGSVTINTGYPANHSVGFSVNRRTDKFNLFSQFGVGTRTRPGISETENTNLSTLNSVSSDGTSSKNEKYLNFILGTDYHFDKFHVLTLSGSYAFEDESELSNLSFGLIDGNGQTLSAWNREESTSAGNPKWQYELQFKKDYKENKDRFLLFSAIGRAFSKDQVSSFANTYSIGTVDNNYDQNINTDFGDVNYTFKLDYTHPFSKELVLETGAQYLLSNVGNDYSVENLVDGNWIVDNSLTNLFEFSQGVIGAYATSAYEGTRWGIKGGLRLESTQLNTLLVNTDEENNRVFTNLFPSLHSSYKVSEAFSLQAGYSRRIYRPRMWDLNPFFNIRNNFNIRTGNPNLAPEFTDSYEVNAVFIADKASLNFGIYNRFTTDVIERIVTINGNVSTSIPDNIGTENTTGIEFNAKYNLNKKITLNGDANYNYFLRRGSFQETNFDFTGDQWSGRATIKFKLPAGTDLELTGNYNSRVQTVQSLVSPYAFADFGIRKKIMKGKIVASLSVRDAFATRVREQTTDFANLYQYSFRQRGRFTTLGISYGFGKGEAMEFSGSRRRR